MNKILDKIADSYFRIEKEAWNQTPKTCNCDNPGMKLACKDCPCYLQVRKKVYSLLHGSEFHACPPPLFFKEEEEEKIDICSIKYDSDLRIECLYLYKEFQDVKKVANVVGIDEDIIQIWLFLESETDSQLTYSEKVQNQCIKLYLKYKTLNITHWALAKITGISNNTLRNWTTNHDTIGRAVKKKSFKEVKDKFIQRYLELSCSNSEKIKILAEEFNLNIDTVRKYVGKCNLYQWKLPDNIRIKCVELYHVYSEILSNKNSSIYVQISKELNISYSSAYRIVQNYKSNQL